MSQWIVIEHARWADQIRTVAARSSWRDALAIAFFHADQTGRRTSVSKVF